MSLFKSAAFWMRIAAAVMLLFAGFHSWGFSRSISPLADGVVRAMKGTDFIAAGSTVNYWGFFLGFGYSLGLFMVAQAAFMWMVGNRLARGEKQTVEIVVLFLCNLANLGLLLRFFFLQPQIMTVLILVLLALTLVLSLAVPPTNRAGPSTVPDRP